MFWRTGNTTTRCWWRDIVLGAVIVSLCVLGARIYLASHGGEHSIIRLKLYIFRPAIMLAGGRGFYEPDPTAFPEADAFIQGKIATLDPATWPEHIPRQSLSFTAASEYHLYLNHTVALFWRLFGISRESLEPLVALMLGWTALAVYGIMRLGMGRVLSFPLALAFAFSPPVLLMLPAIRDFSKAPFLLSLIFVLGYLVRHCRDSKRLLLWAVALGALHGVAMGFRQDALIFVPLALVVLAIVSALSCRAQDVANVNKWRLRVRFLLPLCSYAVLFLLLAWPMLGKMEGGADPYWPLVQGFSARHMMNLGLGGAQYTPLASAHDNYASNTLYHYYRRVNNEPDAHFADHSPIMQDAGRQWLIDMGGHFPADLLARGYASAFRILRYAAALSPDRPMTERALFRALDSGHQRFSLHMHRFGILYAALALLIVSGHNVYLAAGAFLFCLYLFGYVSLQSELPHTFHLAFIPFWITGFLTSRAVHGLRGLYVKTSQGAREWLIKDKGIVLKRMTVFAVCALLLTVLPLWTLRFYQRYAARAALTPCVEAERTARAHSAKSMYGWTLLDMVSSQKPPTKTKSNPEAGPASSHDVRALCDALALTLRPRPIPTHRRARVIVAEFDGSQTPDMMLIRYDPTHSWNHFSQLVFLPRIRNDHGSVFHAFPVYETVVDERVNDSHGRFLGIALPDDQATGFRGFHEIVDVSSIRHLMHLTWAEGDDFSRPLFSGGGPSMLPLHQRITFFPEPIYYDLAPHFVTSYINAADRARLWRQPGTASKLYKMCFLLATCSDMQLKTAEKLLELGETETVLEMARGFLGEDNKKLRRTGAYFLYKIAVNGIATGPHATTASAFEHTRTAFELLVTSGVVNAPELALQAADLFAERNLVNEAKEYYRMVVLAFPEYEAGIDHAGELFTALEIHDEVAFWRDIIASRPDSVLPRLRLADALEGAGRHTEAGLVYREALEQHPDNPDIGMAYLTTSGISLGADTIQELTQRIVIARPDYLEVVIHFLRTIADEHYQDGRYLDAALMYQLAGNHAPEDMDYQFMTARALITALAEGVATVVDISDLTQSPEQKTFSERSLLEASASLAAKGNMARAETLSRTALNLSPDSPAPYLALGGVLESRNILDETLHVYKAAYAHTTEKGNFALKIESICNEAQQPDMCIDAWRELTEAYPEDALAWQQLGLICERRELWAEAEAAYNTALLHDPDNAMANMGLANVLLATDQYADVVETVAELVEEKEGTMEAAAAVLLATATELLESERAADALPVCRLAVEYAPGEPFAWLRLGDAHIQSSEKEEAVNAWRKAALLAPDGPLALEIARRLNNAATAEERLEFWRNVMEEAGDEALIPQLRHAHALSQTGRTAEALERIKILAANHPDDGNTQLAYGLIACRSGDIERGVAQVEKTVAAWPQLARRAARELAAITESLGKEDVELAVAEQLLRAASRVAPEDPQYNARVGQILFTRGNLEEALDQFIIVLMAAPESPHTAALLDEAYVLLNKLEARQHTWERIVAAHPEAEVPRAHLKNEYKKKAISQPLYLKNSLIIHDTVLS